MAEVKRVAVVLFNLGGPDRPDAVEPFLFNLFNDPAIINVPAPIRWLIAKIISRRRTPIAKGIYGHLGGGSPILEQTKTQARALETCLTKTAGTIDWRVEIAMRYWHPFAAETAAKLLDFAPDRIILLPLYPQYSATTTGSSVTAWRKAAKAAGLGQETGFICCYTDHPNFIAAELDLIASTITQVRQDIGAEMPIHVLLSAHGLPKKMIARGDPYQWQVERTAAALERGIEERGLRAEIAEIVTCYQSRVGPLEWIGPATDDEIKRAGGAGAAVVIAPIAFVSEHSETLVELDIEYAGLARDHGVAHYARVPTLGSREDFITCLAGLVTEQILDRPAQDRIVTGMADKGLCPSTFPACPRCG